MQIGVVFPQTEFGDDPALIKDYAQTAEALGYSHILAYDHVLGAVHENRARPLTGPYTERTPFHEPFVLFAYMAAVTSTIGFTTGVIILPQRQTALVAKQAAELDILSGGRLRLGVGTGWNHVEYDALNENFRNRGKRQEEQVEVLRRLWAEDVVDFTGTYHRIDRANILPRPTRPIPIWFGGFNDVAFRRAARIGDGFIFGGGTADALAHVDMIRRYVAEAGRDSAAFGIESMVNYAAGPEKWVSIADSWRAANVDYISLRDMNAGLEGPRAHLDAIRRYAEAVLP
ncbi:MAG: LLM class F420-dependent oxidoreductase [Dehalococcoidia bacterium]|nr:LLM class F420-dependent oxidoreductase [Dehalococcoidia bacterium]